VRASLTPAEWQEWLRLGPADRAEAIATARRLPPALAADARWRAAALLHDVGKAESRVGTAGRVVATCAALVVGPDRVGGRFGRYLRHAQIGEARLAAVGARPEAIAWAGAHHDPGRWATLSIPREVCEALASADGELPPGVK